MEHGGARADRGLIEVERGEDQDADTGWQRRGSGRHLGSVPTSTTPVLNESLEGQGARWRVLCLMYYNRYHI